MGDDNYLVAFSTVPNIGSARLKLLVDYFGSAKAAWEASEEKLRQTGLPKNALAEFLERRSKLNVNKYVQDLENRGINGSQLTQQTIPKS